MPKSDGRVAPSVFSKECGRFAPEVSQKDEICFAKAAKHADLFTVGTPVMRTNGLAAIIGNLRRRVGNRDAEFRLSWRAHRKRLGVASCRIADMGQQSVGRR